MGLLGNKNALDRVEGGIVAWLVNPAGRMNPYTLASYCFVLAPPSPPPSRALPPVPATSGRSPNRTALRPWLPRTRGRTRAPPPSNIASAPHARSPRIDPTSACRRSSCTLDTPDPRRPHLRRLHCGTRRRRRLLPRRLRHRLRCLRLHRRLCRRCCPLYRRHPRHRLALRRRARPPSCACHTS